MNITGTKIKLLIDEPWDASKIIIGTVIQIFKESGKTFFLIDEPITHEIYIVTNRYEGDNLSEMSSNKNMIVAIAKPSHDKNFFMDKDFIASSSFFGIGSIEFS